MNVRFYLSHDHDDIKITEQSHFRHEKVRLLNVKMDVITSC